MTDKVIVACALLLALGYAWMTEQVTTLPFGDPLGPKAFPRILTVALIACALLMLVEMTLSKAASAASKAVTAPAPDTAAQEAPSTTWIMAATVAFTGLYFFLFEPVGFVVSTVAYLFVMTMYFNPGKTVSNALVSVLFPVTCYVVFNQILGVELARGVLPL